VALVTQEMEQALGGPMTPKFLATVGPDGGPNVVPIISLQPWDGQTLVFGEYLMNKTRKNQERNHKVGVLVITEALFGWSMRGSFLGFQETGEKVERVNRGELLRYNAYTSIRAAGSIAVESVSERFAFSKRQVLSGFLRCRLLRPLLLRRAGRPIMPLPVEEKFARLQALRAGAFVGSDGHPRAFPMLSCFGAGPGRLLVGAGELARLGGELRPGTRVAVSILTFEPIAYQVKGVFAGRRAGVGVVDLDECYSASPPRVGARLDRPALA
jgi:hypothetical protein